MLAAGIASGQADDLHNAGKEQESRAKVDEALAALAAGGEDAKVLGGGQSLMPVLRLRLNHPSVLVDVSHVDEMRTVTDEGGALLIGVPFVGS